MGGVCPPGAGQAQLAGPLVGISARRPASANLTQPAIVRVWMSDGSGGSGILIAKGGGQGLCLTNAHVVRDSNGTGRVQFPIHGSFRCRVVSSDRRNDLAALLINEPSGVEPVEIRDSAPSRGEVLTAAGYGPGGMQFRASRGVYRQDHGPGEWFSIATGVRSGDSGGPILDAQGRLCGILWGSDHATSTMAVRLTCIKRFLQQVGNRIAWLAPNLPPRPRAGSQPGKPVDRFGNLIVGNTIPIGGDGADQYAGGYDCPPPRIRVPTPEAPTVKPQPEQPQSLVDLKNQVDALLAEVQDTRQDLGSLRTDLQSLKDSAAGAGAAGPAGPEGTQGPKGDPGPPGPAGEGVDIASVRAAIREELASLKAEVKSEIKRELRAEAIITITPDQ